MNQIMANCIKNCNVDNENQVYTLSASMSVYSRKMKREVNDLIKNSNINMESKLDTLLPSVSVHSKKMIVELDDYIKDYKQHLESKNSSIPLYWLLPYKSVYELKVEISYLHAMLYRLEKDGNSSISLLKEINNLIYEKKRTYGVEFDRLAIDLNALSEEQGCHHASESFDELDKFKRVLISLDFEATLFDLTIVNNEARIIDRLKKANYKLKVYKTDLEFKPIQHFYIGRDDISTIKNGWTKVFNKNDYNKHNSKNGLYLVNFNVLYNKKNNQSNRVNNTLVYSYLSYNTLFALSLMNYLNSLSASNLSIHDSIIIEPRVFVLDKSLHPFIEEGKVDEESSKMSKLLSHLIVGENKTYDKIAFLLLLASEGAISKSSDSIYEMLHALFNNDYVSFWNHCKINKTSSNIITKLLIARTGDFGYDAFADFVRGHKHLNNSINNFYFVVRDLDSLIKKFKDINVNQGPQKWRGMCSLTQSNIYDIDQGFRHHLLNTWEDYNYVEDKDFSFKNIHMNLGNVRY